MAKQHKLGKIQRRQAGESLMALGNGAALLLLFGQAFSEFPFDMRIAVLGVSILILLYAVSLTLIGGDD